MTTITIDQPLQFQKKHFASILEAAYFLMGLQMKQEKSMMKAYIQEGIEAYDKGEYISLGNNPSQASISSALRN